MAKDKVVKVEKSIPDGMVCYQKVGGGSIRFANRIIKSGQKFWIHPESIPVSFQSACKEVAADKGALIITNANRPRVNKIEEAQVLPEKFELVKALDENGKVIKKGESALYNVVGEDGKPLNEKPLRKMKAEELQATLNA